MRKDRIVKHEAQARFFLGVAATLVLALLGPARAADKGAELAAQTAVDQRIYDLLRTIGNQGAELYNSGDRNGSYRYFQGALQAIRPLLDHQPDAQKIIDEGLIEAEKQADLGKRAFELRRALVEVRLKIKPSTESVAVPRKPAAQPDLWERVGGLEAATKIVDEFVEQARKNPKVNFDRGGKYKLDEQNLATLKKNLVGYLSVATGGPLKYTGKDFREAHKGMNITKEEFEALMQDLKKVLEANKVNAKDIQQILDTIGTARNEIIEEKQKGS